MPPPNDFLLPEGIQVDQLPSGNLVISDALVDVLVTARKNYDWPDGTGSAKSQSTIINLEAKVADLISPLDTTSAHSIVSAVSIWGGNRAKAQADIDAASLTVRTRMAESIQYILSPTILKDGLDALSDLPGLRLVMATKIYRFCCPEVGAAADRHASYFFNSLDLVDANGVRRKGTKFRREWLTGEHDKSRLAIYNPSYHKRNRDEFADVYLPLVSQLADALNRAGITYRCAATGVMKTWRPADIEMAVYFWCAHNGPESDG